MSTTKNVVFEREEMASRLLALDESIISVTLANSRGEVLGMKYRSIAESFKPDKELLDRGGSLIAMISALIRQGEASYGDCKNITINFGKLGVGIIPIKSKEVIIALGLYPETPMKQIYGKVARLLEQ